MKNKIFWAVIVGYVILLGVLGFLVWEIKECQEDLHWYIRDASEHLEFNLKEEMNEWKETKIENKE